MSETKNITKIAQYLFATLLFQPLIIASFTCSQNCDSTVKYQVNYISNECDCDNNETICLSKVDQSQTQCEKCIDGYYSSDNQSICKLCQSPCQYCSDDKICTSCDSRDNRELQNNSCVCLTGFVEYLGGCHQCELPCKTCINQIDQCDSCDYGMILDSTNHICSCPNGTIFQNNNCTQCASICLTCKNDKDFCSSCIVKPYLYAIVDIFLILQIQFVCNANLLVKLVIQPFMIVLLVLIQLMNLIKFLTNVNVRPDISQMQTLIVSNVNLPVKHATLMDACLVMIQINLYLRLHVFNQCEKCSKNCLKCQDQYICQQCKDNFELNDRYKCQLKQQSCCQIENLKCSENAELINQICQCKTGYYQDDQTCKQCIYPCNKCGSTSKCLQCNDIPNLQLINYECICLETYFYNYQSQICESCDINCLTCNISSTNCLSCKSYQNREYKNNTCVCISNYYENDVGQCQICTTTQGQSKKQCNYSDCQDLIWTYGEQCDDGNFSIKDGCTNCKIDQGYYCLNTLMQPSQCYKCPENCINCLSERCLQVNYGYWLDFNNMIVKCSEQCLTCILTPSNCLTCKFINISQQQQITNCQLCDKLDGYYTNYTNNQCYTICGDSIKASNEECDDGNMFNEDGCDKNCKIEDGFSCFQSVCTRINYPSPSISENFDYITTNIRQVIIHYNEPLKIVGSLNISEIINIILIDENKKPIKTDFQITQNLQQYDPQLYQVSFTVTCYLKDSLENYEIIIQYLDTNKIINENNQKQQIQQLQIKLSNYFQISDVIILLTEKTITFSRIILYLILTIFIIGFFFGGIEMYFNLIDVLQQFYYLKYINTSLPYNLMKYFQSFSFVQLTFIQKWLQLQNIFDYDLDINTGQNIPVKIKNDGFSGCFFINISSILFIWFLGYISYGISRLTTKHLIKIRIPIIHQELENTLYVKFLIILFFIKHKIVSILLFIEQQFIFNGLFRSFTSCSNELAFYICLSILSEDLRNSSIINYFNILLLVIFGSSYLIIIICLLSAVNKKKFEYKQKSFELKYGSLFEKVRPSPFSIIYNSLLLVKRFLFMYFIVFLYDYSVLQSIFSFILSSLTIIYLLILKDKDNIELKKQFICEIGLLITSFFLSIFCVNDSIPLFQQEFLISLGWVIIFAQICVLITQLIANTIQQWKCIYMRYKIVRKLSEKIGNFFMGKSVPPPQSEQSMQKMIR